MLHVVLSAAILSIALAKPLNSCLQQARCLDLDVTRLDDSDSDGNAQYEICLFYDQTLEECQKNEEGDQISHACTASAGESDVTALDKTEGLSSGRDNALCSVVACEEIANFGFKDGSSCESAQELFSDFGTIDYNEWVYCSDGFDCANKAKVAKACQWAVKAPSCDETTTTEGPTTTGSDPTTTAGDDPCADITGSNCMERGERATDCEADACCAFNEDSGICNLADLTPGASDPIYVRTRIADDGTLTNSAALLAGVYAQIMAFVAMVYVF